jgi:hypothetical protein
VSGVTCLSADSTSRCVLPVHVCTGVSVINVCTCTTCVSFHNHLCHYYILLYLYMYNAFYRFWYVLPVCLFIELCLYRDYCYWSLSMSYLYLITYMHVLTCLTCVLSIGQTIDYKISICCFFAKNTAIRRKSKHWLARNQYNVSIRLLLFLWTRTIKIQLSVLV